MITAFFFFWCLVISSDEYSIKYKISYDLNFLAGFKRFLNPLRYVELEDLFKEMKLSFNGWSHFWDLLGRISVTYGVYQTIQAFRRFGKK
jgi:hypothetical protein